MITRFMRIRGLCSLRRKVSAAQTTNKPQIHTTKSLDSSLEFGSSPFIPYEEWYTPQLLTAPFNSQDQPFVYQVKASYGFLPLGEDGKPVKEETVGHPVFSAFAIYGLTACGVHRVLSGAVKKLFSALEAELFGILQALLDAKRLQIKHLIIENHNDVAMEYCQSKAKYLAKVKSWENKNRNEMISILRKIHDLIPEFKSFIIRRPDDESLCYKPHFIATSYRVAYKDHPLRLQLRKELDDQASGREVTDDYLIAGHDWTSLFIY